MQNRSLARGQEFSSTFRSIEYVGKGGRSQEKNAVLHKLIGAQVRNTEKCLVLRPDAVDGLADATAALGLGAGLLDTRVTFTLRAKLCE